MSLKYMGKLNVPGMPSDTMVYSMGECNILLSGPTERASIGWHFSISCPNRYPTWEEQKVARYELIPDEVYMVMILPPRKEYVNRHPNCFHWHEAGPKFFDAVTGRPKA